MHNVRKGFSTKAAVICLAAVVGVGAIAYFSSDVFRTRINAAADQYTHWTPENIAKDPVNYLNFCESETNKAIEGLKADEIAVAQNQAKLEEMRDDASGKVNVADRYLGELKDLYRTNDSEAGVWPVSWHSQSLDKDATKKQIVSLAHERSVQKNLLDKVELGLKKLDGQKQRITDARAKAQEQLSEIAANRQLLSVQKITDDLTSRLVAMKGALKATVDTASETKGVISLDQLSSEASAAPVSDTEFDKIMSK